jgi:uncharacterized protein
MKQMRAQSMLLIATLAFSSVGCARMFGSYSVAPNGLASSEYQLRSMLASGQATSAFESFHKKAPDDEVLRALYRGVLAYYAGDYAESAATLDTAATLADDRVTKSISRSALSLVSSDNVLPYEPGRTERLLIPYYGALARVRMGDMSGAAVEARRLSLLLQRFQDDGKEIDPRLEATLRYVAGAMFEANGDAGDADVAYRNAFAIDSLLAYTAEPAGTDSGTIVVVLEQGFVAHRVEQGVSVMLLGEEIDAITGEGDNRGAAAAFVASRIVQRAAYQDQYYYDRPARGSTLFVPAPKVWELPYDPKPRMKCHKVESNDSSSNSSEEKTECKEVESLPYMLKVAWPVYHADARPQGARLLVSADTISFMQAADVSRGVVKDFEDERALVVARTIARGTAKLALAKGAERSLEEKNEAAAKIVGLLGNIGSVLTERADTRSWHLLPAGITVARVRLPAGKHDMTVEIDGRTVALHDINVSAGAVSVIPARIW